MLGFILLSIPPRVDFNNYFLSTRTTVIMKGAIILVLGILLNVITHYITQNDDDKTRRYISLSAGTLFIIIGIYMLSPQELQIDEKISLDDIKMKVKLFSQ